MSENRRSPAAVEGMGLAQFESAPMRQTGTNQVRQSAARYRELAELFSRSAAAATDPAEKTAFEASVRQYRKLAREAARREKEDGD